MPEKMRLLLSARVPRIRRADDINPEGFGNGISGDIMPASAPIFA